MRGCCRGQSQYRGVTRHHQQSKWEARIGRVEGNKYLYLGTYDTAGGHDLGCLLARLLARAPAGAPGCLLAPLRGVDRSRMRRVFRQLYALPLQRTQPGRMTGHV